MIISIKQKHISYTLNENIIHRSKGDIEQVVEKGNKLNVFFKNESFSLTIDYVNDDISVIDSDGKPGKVIDVIVIVENLFSL